MAEQAAHLRGKLQHLGGLQRAGTLHEAVEVLAFDEGHQHEKQAVQFAKVEDRNGVGMAADARGVNGLCAKAVQDGRTGRQVRVQDLCNERTAVQAMLQPEDARHAADRKRVYHLEAVAEKKLQPCRNIGRVRARRWCGGEPGRRRRRCVVVCDRPHRLCHRLGRLTRSAVDDLVFFRLLWSKPFQAKHAHVSLPVLPRGSSRSCNHGASYATPCSRGSLSLDEGPLACMEASASGCMTWGAFAL